MVHESCSQFRQNFGRLYSIPKCKLAEMMEVTMRANRGVGALRRKTLLLLNDGQVSEVHHKLGLGIRSGRFEFELVLARLIKE